MMRNRRSFRHHFAIFVCLSIFALAQLGWWIIFQVREGSRITRQQHRTWDEQLHIARQYAADSSQFSLPEFHAWLKHTFPDLELRKDTGAIEVGSAALERLHDLANRRVRMFISEGVFFSALLLLGIGYMYWVLRREILYEQRQTAFISATSHELKTPITSLRLYLDTLSERDLPKPQTLELLATMRQDLDRLTDQIDRLLQAQMLATGTRTTVLQPVNLTDETHSILDEVYQRFDLKGFQLRVHLDPNVMVLADPERWRILLRNLLENAFKYSPDGGALEVFLSRRAGRAQLKISDQGVGFPPAESERIFDRFYRIGNEDTRRTSGTGLGLFLVREIARSFHGSVRAHSEGEGKGATFIVEITEWRDESDV